MKDDCKCITQEMRQKILGKCHAPPYAGHKGIAATTKVIERYFFWPPMWKDILKYVTECLTYQKVKYDRIKAPGLLMPLPIP